ncbi:MAG: hypothetical protein HY670_10680 [Chloroflexi bacterium]|nr:hypothetical protein [Chloroflexota bacterium]
MIVLVLSVSLAACAAPKATPAPTVTATATVTAPPTTATATVTAPPTTVTATPAPAPTVTLTVPAPTPTPTAVGVADFYKDKRVTMGVAYAPGGGVDYSSRVFASFWPTFTGGAMVVENKPGAGGLAMANSMASSAKRDGSELGATSYRSGLAGPWLMQDPGVQYDALKFSYIGSVANELSGLAIGAGRPYNTIADLRQAKGLKFGSLEKSAGSTVATAVLIKLLGLDARLVIGYAGTAELSLAAGRGEIDGYVTGETTIKAEGDKGYVKKAPLVMIERQRGTLFKDVIAITEVVKPSPEDEILLDTSLLQKVRVIFFTPPEVSQDKVAFLRTAFDKVTADSAFMTMMTRYYGIYVPPVTGAEEAKIIARLGSIPKAQFDAVTKLIDQYAGQ